MYLKEVANDSFLLLNADWPAIRALKLIERDGPTHLIIRRIDPSKEYYYVYTKARAQGYLDRYRASGRDLSQMPIREVFELHEYQAVPTVDAYTDADASPGQAVVVEEGWVVGFFETPRMMGSTRGGGATRGGGITRGGSLRGPPKPRVLEADFPKQVQLNAQVSLLVKLTTEFISLDAIPVLLPEDTTIDVLVQTKRGFELVGRSEGSITITDAKETLPLQFKLRATDLGQGELLVTAFHEGNPLGQIKLAPTIVPANQSVDMRRSTHSTSQSIKTIQVPRPDLQLIILEQNIHGNKSLSIILSAADPNLGGKKFGPVRLQIDPFPYFHRFFSDIEKLLLDTANRKRAEKKLEQKGSFLFETLIPDGMRDLLWKHRRRIGTMQILSEEPWIPWELLKLGGKDNGQNVTGPFLCQSVAVTRWFLNVPYKPALSLKKIALVVPGDSGLAFASKERDHMLSLANGGRQVTPIEPANYEHVMKALESGEYDGWHFTGHGESSEPAPFGSADPNRSKIILEGGKGEELTPEDIAGQAKNLGNAKPLVFLNACQVGRGGVSLTDIGGWAKQFLEAEAAAFIGSHWSVADPEAFDFAKAFYSRLLAGIPIGEATRQARQQIKSVGNPTWLAYTVYAHPLAKVAL